MSLTIFEFHIIFHFKGFYLGVHVQSFRVLFLSLNYPTLTLGHMGGGLCSSVRVRERDLAKSQLKVADPGWSG